jgi:hypothetical protein
MAKTESTAVNELIGLVQSGKQTAQEPAGDLLFDEQPPSAATKVQPPRMTTTVPPMRGAGEVAPLPAKRAPHSTASHQQVRVRTASPTRGTTIPPLARPSSPPPIPSRTSSQPVVAPRGSSADVSSTRPPVPSRTTSSHPAVTIPPRTTGSHQAVSPPPVPSRTRTSQQFDAPPAPSRTKTPSQQLDAPPVPSRAKTPSQQFDAPPAPSRTRSQQFEAPPAPSRAKTPSQQIVPPPLGDDDNDVDWDAATVSTMPKSSLTAKPPTAYADIDDAETPVTHSSPTLPSPRVTQPSFPALPKPRPTLPMPKQSAPKLPPPRQTPRASEPPPIGQPFAARSLMNEPIPLNEPTPTDVDIDMDITPDLKPEPKLQAKIEQKAKLELDGDLKADAKVESKPAIRTRAKSEPPPPYASTLAPLVVPVNSDISAKISKEDQTWVGKPLTRASSSSLARKLVIPAVAATLIGVGIGAYLATQKNQQKPAPAQAKHEQFAPPTAPAVTMPETPAAVEAPAPVVEAPAPVAEAPTEQAAAPALTNDVPAPAANDVPAPAVQPAFVDIRIDSNPAGATAVLVDNGKTSFLGTTPLATSLDPSRQYDIVFTYDDRPTQMAHLDPAKDTHVSIKLPRASTSSSSSRRHHSAPAPAAAVAETAAPAPKPAKQAAPMVAEEGGEGTLMVSSKPPCDILIDGKATGLTTPQRSISLAAGVHKVTFVNDAEKIKKTVSVTISADKPTKLIQDLMQH